MPYFPPNTGWSLPDQSGEPSNVWCDRYNQPSGTPNQIESMGLDTQHGLSQTEMLNYLLQFYHSYAPAPVFGPAQNPVQALGFNSADLRSLPQDDYSNGLTGGFNDPSMQSHIANMHGTNQTPPNINPPVQDPIPVQGQEQGPGPASRNPQRAPRRGHRNARSRARPYERP